MSKQPKLSSLQYLASICHDYSSFRTKLAVYSLSKGKNSYLFEAIILTIEYLQLISQALLINPGLYENVSLNVVFKGVLYAAKLINPSFWMFMETNGALNIVLIIGFLGLTVVKLLLLCYMITIIVRKMEGHSILLALWKGMFQIQSRALCFFITSFWVKTIMVTSENGSSITGMSETSIIAISITAIIYEYAFSFVWQDRYCYILPTKNFLAAKDNYLEMLTLTQKLIIQIFQMTFQITTDGVTWVFTSLNLIFCLARESHYFWSLPIYNPKALKYQGVLLSIVFSLNLACFIQNMVHSLGFSSDMSFIIITWILIGVLSHKMSTQYLNRRELELLKPPKKTSSAKFLLHKIIIIKQLRKIQRLPSEYSEKNDLLFLIRTSLQDNIGKILNIDHSKVTSSEVPNIYSKESGNKMILQYLDYLQSKFPRDKLLKLYLAYFYAKKLRLYGVAMKIVYSLQNDLSSKISLGAGLLLLDVEERVEKDYTNTEGCLDVHPYLKSISQEAQMRQKMIEQIELQIKLYNEVLDDSPNLENMFQCSQKIKEYRHNIGRRMHNLLKTMPESYARPLMISALYHLSLSHSVSDYKYYLKRYHQMQSKYLKSFSSDKFTQENLFQDNNVLFLVSSERGEAGKIVFCTKNIEQVYGGEAHSYIGAHIGTLAMPSFRSFYITYFESLATPDAQAAFGVPNHTFGVHKQGYLVEVDFCLAIHPFMTNGFYFDCIARPLPKPNNYILVHGDGIIEGATKEVAEKLGLLRTQRQNPDKLVNIKELSLEFSKIIESFDILEKLKKKQEDQKDDEKEFRSNVTDFDRLQELCSIFTSQGKDIQFNPLSSGSQEKIRKAFHYHCIMVDEDFERTTFKLLALQEIKDSFLEDSDDHSSLEKDNHKQEAEKRHLKSNEDEVSMEDVEKLRRNRSDSFSIEDEKHGGWIDFLTLEHKTSRRLMHSVNTRAEHPDEPLSSPLSVDALISSPKLTFVTEQKVVEKSARLFDATPKTAKTANQYMKENQMEKRLAVAVEASIGSQRSRNSQLRKISSAYKLALSVKDTPMNFKVIALIFYAIVLVILGSQLSIKMKLDTAVSNLRDGKDIIAFTETRSFLLGNVQNSAQLSYDLGSGRIAPGLFPLPAIAMVMALQSNLIPLSAVNQKIRLGANTLSKQASKTLFQDDVRLFDSGSNEAMNMTNFQATDRIVETGMQAVDIMMANFSAAQDQVIFLIRNSMNDLLVKNDEISDTFLENLQIEQTNLDYFINDFVIVTVCLLMSVSTALTFIIYKEYTQEQNNLLAVTKLNRQGIWASLDQISHFKAVILEDVSLEEDLEGEQKETKREAAARQKAKRENSHAPNIIGMRRRYYFYVARVWLLISILIGISIANCIAGRNSIAFFQVKQNQIYFANRLKSHTSLLMTTSQELFASNGTTVNYNEPSLTLSEKALDTLILMKNKLASTFMNADYTYDPQIQDILFVEGCQYIDVSWQSQCYQMKSIGQNPSLIYLLGAFENIVKGKIEQYQTSDKSTDALLRIQIDNFPTFITDYFIIGYHCDSVSNVINSEFTVEAATSQNQRNVILAVFLLVTIIVGCLVWLFVLCVIRDSNTQFKVVLQAFPANLVLSSFVLKRFLIRTSKGALDFVKNSI